VTGTHPTSGQPAWVRLERDGPVATVTLCRPDVLNAQTPAMWSVLREYGRQLSGEIRVVVVRGEGRAFSAGLDLSMSTAAVASAPGGEATGGTAGESDTGGFEALAALPPERAQERIAGYQEAFSWLRRSDLVTIAAVQGHAIGAGFQLALACDIRVSTPDCQLGLPAIKESLIPGLGTWRLPKYIGWGRAKRMILGGENIRGEEARAIGLVDHVAPAEGFFSHVDAIAGRYVRACSTGTRMSKLLTSRAFELDYDAFFQHYLELQERAFTSADASEAKRAYLAKEDPVWK